MKAVVLKKKILFIFLITLTVLLIIFLYIVSSLFMKTTYISDWTGEGSARYYFDNGLFISHSIRRAYKGGPINESQNFQKVINKYYILFPIKIRVVSMDKVNKVKKIAFDELDVMNKDMPMTGRSDCTSTTTFYQHFKSKVYYDEPYGYLGILTELYQQ